MKTSFIATVYNEEENIGEFISSLLNQTQLPNEIIIVDAGSTDATQKLIKKNHKITLLIKNGNRSVGRNFGIKKSTGDIIIVSDAGCVLDKNYIKNILLPFKDNSIDVVSGFYYPITQNTFEKCLATYTCTMPDKIDKENYLPSSRSIAFTRSAFDHVKGYPEDLDTCEDLIFAVNMKKSGCKFKFSRKAFVRWKQQKNLIAAFKQFYNYAKGDGQARYFRPQTPFIFIRYILGLILLILAIYQNSLLLYILICFLLTLYILWSINKNYKYVSRWSAFFYLPSLQLLSDLAVISGMIKGLNK